jgi:hypothetical protein
MNTIIAGVGGIEHSKQNHPSDAVPLKDLTRKGFRQGLAKPN